MKSGRTALLFDLDETSLAAIRQGLPGWTLNVVGALHTTSVDADWPSDSADLFVLGVTNNPAETVALCRLLVARSTRSHVPTSAVPNACQAAPARRQHPTVLVLVSDEQGTLVGAALRAGAHSCLPLPLNAKHMAKVWAHADDGNQPGRHTRNLDRAQHSDPWRDDGGQG